MRSTASTRARGQKTERLELRVTASAKRVIEQASSLSGLAAGDLAYEGARRILEEHERMALRGEDREAFLAAIMDPPEPTPRLMAAFRRYRQVTGQAPRRR